MAEILHKDLVGDDIHELRVTLSSQPPNTIPKFVGQGIYDIINKKFYVAQGTSLITDWVTTPIPPFLIFADTRTIKWNLNQIGDEVTYEAEVDEAELILTASNVTDFDAAVLAMPEIISLLADQHTRLILRTGSESGAWSPQTLNGLELDSNSQKIKLSQNLSITGNPTFDEVTLTIKSKTPLLTLTAGGVPTAASVFLDTNKGVVVRGDAGSINSFALQNEVGADVLLNPVSSNQILAPSLAMGASAPGLVHADASGLLSASKIVNADVDGSAAIAGTKIDPDFGSQNIETTGSVLVDTIESNTNDISILSGNDNKTIAIGTGSGFNTINLGGPNSTVNITGATYTTPIDYVSEDKNIVVNFNASGQDSPDSGLYVQEEYAGAQIDLTAATWQSGNIIRYTVDVLGNGVDGLIAGEYLRITGFTSSDNNGTFKVLTVNTAYIDAVNPKRTNSSADESGATALGARLLLNGYIHVASDRMSWEAKAPAHAGIIQLKTQSAAKTLQLTSESLNDVTVKFNTNLTFDQDLQKTSSVEFANIKTTDLGTGVVHSDVDGNFTSSLIVNADVDGSAAIAGTKIDPDFGSQNIETTGNATTKSIKVTGVEPIDGATVSASPTDGVLLRGQAGTASQFKFISDTGTNLVTIKDTGEITLHNLSTTGVVKTTLGVLNSGLLTNADVDASAAIAGTKIDPDFGSQNIETTGSITINDAIISSFSSAGVVHNDALGNLSTSLIVDADISATAAISDSKLATISTVGKVLNSATTATEYNVGDTIVARDSNGDFSARKIQATDILATSNSLNLGTSADTITILGNLAVQGATTTLNTATLDVEDKNITVNKGGLAAAANDSGLTIEGDGSPIADILYDSSIISKFKLGAIGSESEVITSAGNQQIIDKTATNLKINNYEDLNGITAAAVPDPNYVRLYAKTDGKLYLKASDGLEFLIRTGADPYTPVINAIEDYHFESTVLNGPTTFSIPDNILIFDFWSGTSPLNTAKSGLAGAGTQNAALAFGGNTGSVTAVTEKFNGSTWSANGAWNLSAAKQNLAGAGTQNAALAFGGYTGSAATAVTEKFNGSAWSTNGAWNLSAAKFGLAGAGTQGAALAFGGYTGSAATAVTEKFNGSTWSTTGNLSAAKYLLVGAGTQNAALAFGGTTGISTAVTEKFNGSTWSTTGNLSAAKQYSAGAGTQNAGLVFGGTVPPATAVTEKFNGSVWITTGGLSAAKYNLAGAGTQNAVLAFGGTTNGSNYLSATEKFNGQLKCGFFGIFKGTLNSINISSSNTPIVMNLGSEAGILQLDVNFDINGGLSNQESLWITELEKENYQSNQWSTVAYLNTAKNGLAGAGTQNAALAFGGFTGSRTAVTEKFNGSAWSTTGNLSAAKNGLAGAGIQNAALAFGGYTGSRTAVTEKFNGSTWSTNGAWNLSVGKEGLAGAGTQNAALAFGGTTGIATSVTEKFNGSAWSTTGNLSAAKFGLAGAGTQNAALAFGGSTGSVTAVTEKFNGSAWSTTGNLSVGKEGLAGVGTQNAALAFGGTTGIATAVTEKFNGSTWSTAGSLSAARYSLAGAGTQNAALALGGYAFNQLSITEKFNYNIEFIPKTLGNGVWSLANDLNAEKNKLAGAGTQDAALAFGGENNTANKIKTTEKFNGNSWSLTGDLSTEKSGLAGVGTQGAALAFGGTDNSSIQDVTENFNGSAWSVLPLGILTYGRDNFTGVGTQNAALAVGSNIEISEKFDGTSWAASASLSTKRYGLAGAGTQNSALVFGGLNSPASVIVATTEKFNGGAWSLANNLNAAKTELFGAGTQNAALAFGGYSGSSYLGVTEKFNGNIWTVSGNLTAGSQLAGAGKQNGALAFGGYNGISKLRRTEKYTEISIDNIQIN